VGLFFVLRGFVLALPLLHHHKSLSYAEFVIHRCFRIHRAYWLALIIAGAQKFFVFDSLDLTGLSDWVTALWSKPARFEDMIRHIALVGPLDTSRINPVIWTMVFEITISLIFP
jgi:peptidoglycan/LPS O-acetylase OafA/YrhL